MASQKNTIDFILHQIRSSGEVSAKKMFGEYGVYCNGKIVALVCDDELFIKPTEAGEKFIGNEIVEHPPYPGAKPYFLISRDKWDDSIWLTHLVRISAEELPLPKKKKPLRKKIS